MRCGDNKNRCASDGFACGLHVVNISKFFEVIFFSGVARVLKNFAANQISDEVAARRKGHAFRKRNLNFKTDKTFGIGN